MAEQIAASGLRTVQGNLIADDTYFVHQPYGTGWEHDDLAWLSAAQSSALAINDNVLFLSVFPGPAGQPARIEEVPMAGYYALDNRALTVSRTVTAPGGGARRSRRNLGIGREPGSMKMMVWGEIPEGAPESSYSVSVEDPPQFAGEYLRRELASRGVEVKGKVEVRRLEPQDVDELAGEPRAQTNKVVEEVLGVLLAEHESQPLGVSLRAMLKVSQNLHAEMLLRTLGKQLRGVGSAEAGLAAIDDFLLKNGIAPRAVALRDGSGLSRQNLITPAAMTALLKHMYQSEHGAEWTAMLPEAGVDGTLRNRLRGRYTTGRVWAKTGSLQGVVSLAGYVRNQSDDLLAFAIFANHYNEDEGSVLTVIDNIVTALARSR
jgi:D-alanyl-D-alanine carboxypeptidase/D-alanyl-D-alanine-endopeptidase (penicillin-binding protein 4)